MRRRTVLATVGAGLATVTGGCFGYSVQSQDEVDGRKERITQLEDDNDELEAELETRRTRVQELETEIENKDRTITSQREEVRQLEREKISELYALAHSNFEAGERQFGNGESSESDGTFDLASAQFANANGYYNAARANAKRAAEVATDIGESAASSTLEDAAGAFDDYRGAALNYANENLYRSRGDTSTADQFESDGDSNYSSAQSKTVPSPDDVDDELGL